MTIPEYAFLAVSIVSAAIFMAKLLLNVAKEIDNFMKEAEDVRTSD